MTSHVYADTGRIRCGCFGSATKGTNKPTKGTRWYLRSIGSIAAGSLHVFQPCPRESLLRGEAVTAVSDSVKLTYKKND